MGDLFCVVCYVGGYYGPDPIISSVGTPGGVGGKTSTSNTNGREDKNWNLVTSPSNLTGDSVEGKIIGKIVIFQI